MRMNVTNSSSIQSYECIEKVVFIVRLSLTLLCFLVYAPMVVTIVRFRKSQLKSSYFTICLSAAVADFWYTAHKYFILELPRWFFPHLVQHSVWYATLFRLGNWGIYYAQVFGIWLLTVNRFTALCFPKRHDNFWSSKLLCLAFVLQWGIAACIAFPMLLPTARSGFVNENLEIVFIDKQTNAIYWTFNLTLEIGFLMPNFIIFYSIMFYRASRQRVRSVSIGGSRLSSRAELRLALSGALIAVVYGLMQIPNVFWALGSLHVALNWVWYSASDLFTGINPILLLVFSDRVRNCFYATVKCSPNPRKFS